MSTALVSLLTVVADDNVTPDPDTVTPGIIGFIVTFAIALITVFLVIDMVRRVRRVNLRAQVLEELEAEVAARDAAAGEMPKGETPKGPTSKGDTSKGGTPKGETPKGDTSKGETSKNIEKP